MKIYRLGLILLPLLHLAGPSLLRAAEVPFALPLTPGICTDCVAVSGDLDRDGDLDLAVADADDDAVFWLENTTGDGSAFTRHDLTTTADDPRDIEIADIDGDGDLDLVTPARNQGYVTWWENDLDLGATCGSDWCPHSVTDSLDEPMLVATADFDRDGDFDIAVYDPDSDLLVWHQNASADGSVWSQHTIDDDNARGLLAVLVADVDGDGDPDLVIAGGSSNSPFGWWENDLGSGTACGTDWCEHVLATGVTSDAAVGDLDGDGDLDILRDLDWWQNNAGDGSTWTTTTLAAGTVDGLETADVDGDGDLDILGLEGDDWLDNTTGDASAWTTRSISDGTDIGHRGFVDLDGDGDRDLLSLDPDNGGLLWRENITLHRSAAFPVPLVTTTIPLADNLVPADFDGDGDLDLVVSGEPTAEMFWLEHDGDPTDGGWIVHDLALGIETTFYGSAYDLDGDGDLDLALSAYEAGEILWLENDGSPADGGWTLHVVDATVVKPAVIAVGDLNGDGAPDLAVALTDADEVVWYQNDNYPGVPTWTRHLVGTASYPVDLEIGDIDGDGDPDLAATAGLGDAVYWYENDGDPTDGQWTRYTARSGWNGTFFMDGCDVDADGDLDLVVTAINANDVGWLENDGTPTDGTWTRRLLVGNFTQATDAACVDLDADGDVDVATTGFAGEVRAYLSDGTPTDGGWQAVQIADGVDMAYSIAVADLDGDGRQDLAATIAGTGEIPWWRNLGGQFALPTTDEVALPTPVEGSEDVLLLRIDAAHRGRTGDDDIEIVAFELLVDDGSTPLLDAEFGGLVDVLRLQLDDGDGVFEPDVDTVLLEQGAPFALTEGVLTLMLDGAPSTQLSVDGTSTFWVAIDLAADATSAVPDRLRITHLTGLSSTDVSSTVPSSTGEMASTDLPLVLEGQVEVSATIDVNDPIALLPIPDQQAGTGVNFLLELAAFVADEDDLLPTFEVTGLPDWLSLSPEGVLSGRPRLADTTASPLSITVTVTDAAGTTDSGDFELSVTEVTETLVVDGICTLGDAILAAESNAQVGACISSGGVPTILLDADALLTEADELHSTLTSSAFAGLPDITVEMTIRAGQATAILRSDTLSCDESGTDHFRLLNVESGGRLTLDGVTLENGCARRGGAIHVTDGSLTLINSRFLENRAHGLINGGNHAAGGAILLNTDGRLESATDCTFEGNVVVSHGNGNARGGALNTTSNAAFVGPFTGNELIANEVASSSSGGLAQGGAISVLCDCSLVVTDSVISSNRATGGDTDNATAGYAFGGAVYADVGAATFERVVFENNQARGGSSSSDDNGGDARGGTVASPTLTLRDVEIRGSSAQGGDGRRGGSAYGGAVDATQAVVERVTMLGAEAVGGEGHDNRGGDAQGGAMAVASGTLEAHHLTVSDSFAVGGAGLGFTGGSGLGGAVYLDGLTSAVLHHLTLIENGALGATGSTDGTAEGGGVYAEDSTLITMSSSILAGNTIASGLAAPTAEDCSKMDNFTSSGYNVVEAPGNCSFAATGDQTDVDPLALDLTELGCAATLPDGSCVSVHPLAEGSPALDTGSCTVSGATVDARGFARPYDVPEVTDADDGCDAGAYEFHQSDTYADVGVSKSNGAETAVPGGTVVYTLFAWNAGPATATGVGLVDALPAALACEWSSVGSGGASGNTASGSGDLDETLFLPAGASVTYSVDCDVAPDATGTLINTAIITADQTDDNAANDSATDTDTLVPSADLSLELSADPLDAVPGEETVLLATLSNDGPSTSNGSQISATLPAGLTFVSSSECGHQNGDILCPVGDLDPGEEITGQVTVLVDGGLTDGTEITVEASLSADAPDPDAADNTDSVTLVVATPLFRDGFETGNTSAWSTTFP